MKKICLLAIASFCSALAFSQNAVSSQTTPGQPKAVTTVPVSATSPALRNANGQVATPTTGKVKASQKVSTKAVATKPTISSKTAPAAAY